MKRMLRSLPGIIGALLIVGVGPAAGQATVEGIELQTSDGVIVFGDLYATGMRGSPTILLFHQAGASGHGEYDPILPTLLKAGYNAIVVDQRSGGDRFGGVNQTVAAAGEQTFGYCDVYPDLEAALDHATDVFPESKIAVWGSSYSAALVFQLAARHPADVSAVLAFSPASGEPMDGCRPEQFIGLIEVPVLVLRPGSEVEYESVAAQLATFEAAGFDTFVSVNGVHGSSMLVEERTQSSTDEVWAVVEAFLAKTIGP